MSDVGQLIAYWGDPAVFVVVVLGNLALPVPEETIVISAVAGDNVGYWLGRRYGQAAVERLAGWLGPGGGGMGAEGGLVRPRRAGGGFLRRFFPGLRFLAGPLAGASGLGLRPFFVANVLGAAVFVPYGVGLG